MTYMPDRQRPTRRLSAWGVMLAFLLQTLAWSAMPVYAKDADDEWMVICTSEGVKWILLAQSGIQGDGPAQDNPSPTLVDHCDLCVFAHGLGMAPAAAMLYEGGRHVLLRYVHSAQVDLSSKRHTPQQPRAPPVHELT